MFKICIRADGGKNVGMGHIMRCLSLAQTFQRNGYEVCFLSNLDEGIEAVRRENFDVVRLPYVGQETEGFFYGNPAYLAEEANAIITFLLKRQIDILVIDTYNVSSEYFLQLKPCVKKLVYIDDINKFPYAADIIVNGNITGKYMGYRQYNKQQVLLLGPGYNMIRKEFRNLPTRSIREQVAEVMITTGGTDPYHLTSGLLACLLQHEQFQTLRFNVLIGSGFTDNEQLIDLSQNYDNIVLYANSAVVNNSPNIIYSEVSAIMLRSDLAISAGGSTLYELAACGTPTLAFVLADNQEFIVQKMEELGYVQSVGWYDRIKDGQVIKVLLNLIHDYEKRKEMSRKGQKLVDGKGTERIVRSIIESIPVNG
jgi:UDP-2,4-diacetamido-2,4,6-trideoxy-beta-L-altropyranose hydrolase